MREEKAWLSKGELGKGKKKEWCGALCYRDRNKGRASRVKGEKKPCLLQYKVGSDDLLTIRPINRPTGQQGDRQLAGWQVTAIFSSPTDSCASIPCLSPPSSISCSVHPTDIELFPQPKLPYTPLSCQ